MQVVAQQCFNSTLVQLKVWFDRATNTLQISFNSTLVQLKASGVTGKE